MRRLPGLLLDSGPVLVLAGIAAAGSFTHIRDTAAEHGQHGWMAWAIAVCIDLTCVMAARERQRDKRIGRATGALSWPTCVLVGGILLSLAANLAQAEPTPWGWVTAATPAVAFLVAVSMLERRAAHTPAPAPEVEHAGCDAAEVEPAGRPAVQTVNGHRSSSSRPEVGPAPDPAPPAIAAHGQDRPSPAPSSAGPAGPGPSPALVNYARQVAEAHQAQHGKPITRDQLRARLRVGTDLATALLREIRTEPV
nr:DUF2637 domain-containing protein [Thermomonospora amylolytica]